MTYRSTWICRLALGLILAGLSACASTNAPQKQGRSAEVHSAIAAQYVRRGELDAAQRHAQIALDAEPRDGDALTIMAVVLQREVAGIAGCSELVADQVSGMIAGASGNR